MVIEKLCKTHGFFLFYFVLFANFVGALIS